VASRRIYSGRVLDLDIDTVRFPNGHVGELEIIRHSGASAVVPFLDPPGSDDPRILLLRQYRYAAEDYLFEVPAGRLDPGE
jgi:ADP-ribose pyrophosphatase